jgi:hypothetical protein
VLPGFLVEPGGYVHNCRHNDGYGEYAISKNAAEAAVNLEPTGAEQACHPDQSRVLFRLFSHQRRL